MRLGWKKYGCSKLHKVSYDLQSIHLAWLSLFHESVMLTCVCIFT